MRKTNKGFTLVELVVVIAIIGVLAAILVPSMLTYVKKARLKTANGNAKTAYNAVAEYVADKQIQGTAAATAVGQFGTGAFNAGGSGLNSAQQLVADVLKDNEGEAGYVAVGMKSSSDSVFFAKWGKASGGNDGIIGQYPAPIQWEQVKAGGTGVWTYIAPAS